MFSTNERAALTARKEFFFVYVFYIMKIARNVIYPCVKQIFAINFITENLMKNVKLFIY